MKSIALGLVLASSIAFAGTTVTAPGHAGHTAPAAAPATAPAATAPAAEATATTAAATTDAAKMTKKEAQAACKAEGKMGKDLAACVKEKAVH